MKFDAYLTECLREAAAQIAPDPVLRTRVRAAAGAQRTRRPRRMAVAAVLVCLTLGTALAAGPVAYLISGVPRGTVTSAAEVGTLEQALGYDVRLPEAVNGLSLEQASVLPWNQRDTAGNTVGGVLTMHASYTDGDSRVTLNAEPSGALGDADRLSDATCIEAREVDGLTVTYRQIPTITVPPDAGDSFTADELAAEARGELFLSVGSATREEAVYHSLSWTQDGVRYAISAYDSETDWTADDFFAAMQDVMQA